MAHRMQANHWARLPAATISSSSAFIVAHPLSRSPQQPAGCSAHGPTSVLLYRCSSTKWPEPQRCLFSHKHLPISTTTTQTKNRNQAPLACDSQPRATNSASSKASAAEEQPLYLDDPYGGFKGQRTSPESSAWAAAGVRIPIHTPPPPSSSSSSYASPRPPVCVFVAEAPSSSQGQQSSSTSAVDCNVLVLPGFPSPSYLARGMCAELVALRPGLRTLTIDWPGIGESDAPQDGIGGFKYNLDSFVQAVKVVAEVYQLRSASPPSTASTPLVVVGHGFIGTAVAAIVARDLKADAVVLLAPTCGRDAYELPKELRKLRNPLIGPLLTGNPAHMADKVFSSATPYAIVEEDMQVLRSVYMRSGGPGFAARSIACNFDWRAVADRATDAIRQLSCPVALAMAQGDRWLGAASLKAGLEELAKQMRASGNEDVEIVDWQFAGHFIFDDAPSDCAKLVHAQVAKVL